MLNLFNVLETPSAPNPVGQNTTNQNSYNSLMNEKMAVNAIQKSLMQVESTVKSPSPVNICDKLYLFNILLYYRIEYFNFS